jgi:hypothetical protein
MIKKRAINAGAHPENHLLPFPYTNPNAIQLFYSKTAIHTPNKISKIYIFYCFFWARESLQQAEGMPPAGLFARLNQDRFGSPPGIAPSGKTRPFLLAFDCFIDDFSVFYKYAGIGVGKLKVGFLPFELICFSRHNEIVLMQPLYFMGPPGDCHFSPFSQNGGMVIFFAGNAGHLVREAYSLVKIFEPKLFFQAHFAIFKIHIPSHQVRKKLVYFIVAQSLRRRRYFFTV